MVMTALLHGVCISEWPECRKLSVIFISGPCKILYLVGTATEDFSNLWFFSVMIPERMCQQLPYQWCYSPI